MNWHGRLFFDVGAIKAALRIEAVCSGVRSSSVNRLVLLLHWINVEKFFIFCC